MAEERVMPGWTEQLRRAVVQLQHRRIAEVHARLEALRDSTAVS
jgi:hypothetical protein